MFALRAVGLDLARRALLRQAAPQALQNTARIARRALGLEQEIPLEELRAEAERCVLWGFVGVLGRAHMYFRA